MAKKKLNPELAQQFARWFSANYDHLRDACIYEALWNGEVAASAFMRVYEAIEKRGATVEDFKFYYLRAYHNERVDHAKRETAERRRSEQCLDIDNCINISEIFGENEELVALAAEDLADQVMRYVRDNYTERDATIFEIYVALQPRVSYTKLAKMLGVKRYHVWHVMLRIRKDIAQKYGPARRRLRTMEVSDVL